MRFRSRVGAWYYVLLAIFAALTGIAAGVFFSTGDRMLLFTLIVGGIDLVIFLSLLLLTGYTFGKDALIVRTLWRTVIPYRCIRETELCFDASLAPALSLRRIAIFYVVSGEKRKTFVSPRDREAFLAELSAHLGKNKENGGARK